MVVQSANVDEAPHRGEAPEEYLERITQAKLDVLRENGVGAAGGILVADTIVVAAGDTLLGKPAGAAQARALIERLSGATHRVTTRFGLADGRPRSGWLHAQSVSAQVTFRRVLHEEAEAYAATGEGYDKAGGYALQGRAAAFIERLEGSYTTVVGLPLCEVVVAMRALGWL
jgi:septum formation protein